MSGSISSMVKGDLQEYVKEYLKLYPNAKGFGKYKNDVDDERTATTELMLLMQPYRRLCNFLGVCASDQVDDLMDKNYNIDKFSLIYNTLSTKDDPKEISYWVAIYCDGMSI